MAACFSASYKKKLDMSTKRLDISLKRLDTSTKRLEMITKGSNERQGMQHRCGKHRKQKQCSRICRRDVRAKVRSISRAQTRHMRLLHAAWFPVLLYVCAYVYMYICSIWMYIYTCIHTYIYVCMYVHVREYTRTETCIHTWLFSAFLHVFGCLNFGV
jgi:hypothetical protein